MHGPQITNLNVLGDQTRIQQIFNTLLSNSIYYTKNDGQIQVSIQMIKRQKKDMMATIKTYSQQCMSDHSEELEFLAPDRNRDKIIFTIEDSSGFVGQDSIIKSL